MTPRIDAPRVGREFCFEESDGLPMAAGVMQVGRFDDRVAVPVVDMPGGMSFDDVRAAVPDALNVISDPPRELDLDLARRHVDALDQLPRPTLVSCRAGPRASAVVYMYAGLQAGSDPDEVLAAVERDGAPCAALDTYETWIADAIDALRRPSATPHEA